MNYIRACLIAFSMYSRLPVPQISWEEKPMRYALIFFPWVGLVIGAVLLLWDWLGTVLGLGEFAKALITTAIPLLITGGFHADGFMDSCDAFHSYRERERKLEILKDPHIGAFSVLMLLLYYLIYLACVSEVIRCHGMFFLSLSFPVSRCFSGLAALHFKKAKEEGSLNAFTDRAETRAVSISLVIQLWLCFTMVWLRSPEIGIMLLLSSALFFFYYRWKAERELRGVTGDTAGWYLTMQEAISAVVIAGGLIVTK